MTAKTALRALAVTAFTAAATAAAAHPSLAPHTHPHGETLLLGLEQALLAAAAVVIVGAAALVVGRSRAHAAARRGWS